MNLTMLTPMLYTKDILGTIDFYVNILGFSCTNYQIEWGWAIVINNNIEIMISIPNKHLAFEKSHFTGSFYFKTTDIHNTWSLLKDTTDIVYPLNNFDYGMIEFAILDNNGYVLQFGQAID